MGEQRSFHLRATRRGQEALRERPAVIGADVRGQLDARNVIAPQQRDAENRCVRHDCGAIRDVTPWRGIPCEEHVDLGGVVDMLARSETSHPRRWL